MIMSGWPIYTIMNSSSGRPCWSVHGSGRVCPGSASSRSRCALTGILETRVPFPQILAFLGGARFIAGAEKFLELLGYGLVPGPTLKKPCATFVRSEGRTANTDFLPAVSPDSFGRTLLLAVLTLSFCIYVLFFLFFFNTLVPSTFSSYVSSFWSLTGHNIRRDLNSYYHSESGWTWI